MATNSFGNRILMQPMGMVKRGGGGGYVPNVFPSSSQCTHIRFPKCSASSECVLQDVPKAPHFYPILFGYGWTSMYIICNENYHNSSPKAMLWKLIFIYNCIPWLDTQVANPYYLFSSMLGSYFWWKIKAGTTLVSQYIHWFLEECKNRI
jgi:hypothetical protein